jgi:RHS repeat-associated protein
MFTYSYNALNELDSYTINGVRTNLLLDGAGNVIAAFNASGNLIANYQYGLGLISQQAPGGSSSFYDFDLTGNTTAITNSAGVTVNTYSYLPFGEKLSSTGPTGNLFTYSGASGVLDVGDGFYQTENRTYSPNLGRFIQPDPSGFGGGDLNLYRYVANAPTIAVDPTGEAIGGVGGSGGAGGGGNLPPPGTGNNGPGGGGGGPPEKPPSTEDLLNLLEKLKKAGGGLAAGSAAALIFVVELSTPAGASPGHENFGPRYLQLEETEQLRLHLLTQAEFRLWEEAKNSLDPNEIVGPASGEASQYVTANQPLSYTVFFENEPTATAPAHDVTVTTTLDPNVDLSTFELLSIGWGNEVLSVPPGLTSYSTRVSYVQPNTGNTILVDVSAALDFSTRTLTWTFTTLDPTTLDTPADPLEGFLPPDNSTGQGTGYVSYAVDSLAGLATGAVVSAAASIVFDHNAAISTATWTNTIDAGPPPTSTVTALPATTDTPSFTVAWSGSDSAGPGISGYNIYVSDDGGSYSLWQAATTATSATYTGQVGHTYQFYSVASNDLGFVQPTPIAAQATITVVPPPPPLVTMTGVHEVLNKKHQVKEVIITFSGAVNSAEAGNTGIYRLATPGKHRSYTAKSAGLIKLKKAAFSAANDTVTLTPKKAFALTKPVQLIVNGTPPSGLQDTLGRFLDGGTSAVAILTKGKVTIDAVAENPAGVRLALKPSAVDAVLEREKLVRSKHSTGRARSIRA